MVYHNYHAGAFGYSSEAPMDNSESSGSDPRGHGSQERRAVDLALSPMQTVQLRDVAWQELHTMQRR